MFQSELPVSFIKAAETQLGSTTHGALRRIKDGAHAFSSRSNACVKLCLYAYLSDEHLKSRDRLHTCTPCKRYRWCIGQGWGEVKEGMGSTDKAPQLFIWFTWRCVHDKVERLLVGSKRAQTESIYPNLGGLRSSGIEGDIFDSE